jgi:hypothetical protein
MRPPGWAECASWRDCPRRRAGASGVRVVKDGARGWTAPDTKKPRLVGRGWVRDALDGVLASSATQPGEGVELELLPVSAGAQPLRLRAHGGRAGFLRDLADPDVGGVAHGMRCAVPRVGEDMGASIAIPIATDRSMSTTARGAQRAPLASRAWIARRRSAKLWGATGYASAPPGCRGVRRRALGLRARAPGESRVPCTRPRSPTIS